jgi:hypothetical protein
MPSKITPFRLGKSDKKRIEEIRKKYSLDSNTDAVRLSLRVVSQLDLPAESVAQALADFQKVSPDGVEVMVRVA